MMGDECCGMWHGSILQTFPREKLTVIKKEVTHYGRHVWLFTDTFGHEAYLS